MKKKTSIVDNVLANWMGQLVFMISGFVLPRLISDHLSAERLGLWYFGWTFVGYSQLLALGIAGAVNRYVAWHRARDDWDALNRVVSSSLVILTLSCLVALVATGVFTWLVPILNPRMHPDHIEDTRIMLVLLGIGAAIQLPGSVFNGVIGGYERFDLKNAVRIFISIGSLGTLALLLVRGYELVALAGTILGGEILRILLQFGVAKRICPHLRFRPRFVSWSVVRDILGFGGKSVLQQLSRSLLYYTNGLIVTFALGPVKYAIYNVQVALVTNASRVLIQYAHVFIPATAALHAGEDQKEIERLFLQGSRYAAYITLPIIAFLVVLGGPIVHVWMGDEYERPGVLALLAIGHAAAIAQRPTLSVLTGLHVHGRPAIAELVAALVSVGLGWLFVVELEWGLLGAAWAVAIPVTLSGGVVLPVLGCRAVKLDLLDYVLSTMTGPLIAVVPLVVWLLATRQLWSESMVLQLVAGVIGGGLLVVLTYWIWVIPSSLKTRVKRVAWGRPV